MIVLTCARNEKFIPAVRKNLEAFWPTRPRTFFVSDGTLEGPDVISVGERSFVRLLGAALDEIQARMPGCDYVHVLLEDLCPLWPVDAERVERLERAMRARGTKFYYMPWRDATEVYLKPEGSRCEATGVRLVEVDAACPFYNSLANSVWQVDYLRWVVDRKLAAGIDDPWRFEKPIEGNEIPHYFAEMNWPTVRSGFLKGGRLNKAELRRGSFPRSALSRRIDREEFGPLFPVVNPAYRIARRIKKWRKK